MVNHRSAVDPRFLTQSGLPVAKDFMNSTVRFIRKDPNATRMYDQATRTWSGDGFTVVYEGQARLQPYGILRDELLAQDPSAKRFLRVQIGAKALGIQMDDFMTVTVCDDNPDAVNYEYTVRSPMNASFSWLTDLIVEGNLKGA